MGVSNVNNLKNIDLSKLSLLQKSKGAQSSKPEYMKMTGSIFNAPQVKAQSTTTTQLTTLNTNRSITDFKSQPKQTEEKKEESINNNSVKSLSSQAKKGTQETETNTKAVKNFSAEGKKLRKNAQKDEKKFQSQLQQQQQAIIKDNAKLEKLIQASEEAQLEINNAQNELDGLLGSSSFTLNAGNGTQGGQSTNPNQDRIKQLQSIIGSKTNLVQSNGTQIYSLRRSSSRTLSRMNRTNANFIKINKQNTKAIKQNQTQTSGAIKTATKIEQLSAITEQAGKVLDLTGQGLVTAGQALASSLNPVTAAIGSAMIATGTVMSKIGTVAEMVGQYGQTAANITKTVAYAAEGNLMGAMTSATAAIQTGAAAAKSTKNLEGTFGQIDQRAQEATKKATANQVAKEQVKEMKKNGELSGMTKKQEKDFRKNLSKDLQATEFGKKDANITGNWSKKQAQQYKEQMTTKGTDGQSIVDKAKNNVTKKYNTNLKSQLEKAGLDGKFEVKGGKIIDKTTGSEVSIDNLKKAGDKGTAKSLNDSIKNARKTTNSSFANAATKAKRSTQKFDFQKFSQGIMSTAALFNAQNTGNAQGTSGSAPQWNLDADPKMRRIRKSRIATMRHASYV